MFITINIVRTRNVTSGEKLPPDVSQSTNFLAFGWVDLIDVSAGQRVLLVDGARRRAEAPLRARGAQVRVIERGELVEEANYDLVCVDGVRLRSRDRRALLSCLAADGRWAQVSDNILSPLRAYDRLRGKRGGSDPRASWWLQRRRLRRSGIETTQLFTLLRSSQRPATAFDVLSSSAMATTVTASLSHIGGRRGHLLRALGQLPPVIASLFSPAWLLVGEPTPVQDAPRRIVAKIANRDSFEVKLIRGDPPSEVEKHYALSSNAAEIAALRELADVHFDMAPRLLYADATTVRYKWMDGESLAVGRLDSDALIMWTYRAARVLAQLQHATRHDDDTVLVHGDFWLGNLLVDGDSICGVIDWETARRGKPDEDRSFLVSSLAKVGRSGLDLRERLVHAVDQGFG